MAFNFMGNVKSLTSNVSSLKKELSGVYDILRKIKGIGPTAFGDVNAAIHNGGQFGNGTGTPLFSKATNIPTTKPRFGNENTVPASQPSSQSQVNNYTASALQTQYLGAGMRAARFGIAQGVAQAVVGGIGGVAGMLPDTGAVATRAGSFYSSSAMFGGTNRTQNQLSTMAAMRGGITGPMGTAEAFGTLTNYSFMPGSANMRMGLGQVSAAAKALNMDNATAANAIGALSTGSMGAQLYQYGIRQYDDKGNLRTPGAMAKDIMQRVFYPGQDVTKIGAEQFAKDSMGMNLDYQLSTMGITGETARLMKASMGNVAAGKSGELTKFDTSGNPINFDYKIRDSEERLAQKSEKGLLVGANTAADALVKLNAALENTPELILAMKGAMQTFTGTKSGGGLSGGLGSIVAGGATIAQSALTLKALQTLGGKAGPTAGRALSTVAKGGVVGTAAALGGQALKGGAEHGSLRSRAENAMKWGGTAAAGAAMFNAIPIGGQIAFGAATAVGAGLGFLFGGPNDGFSASVGGFSQGAVNPSSMSGASSTPMAMPVPGASMSSTSASVTKGAGFGAKDPSMTTMTGAVNYHTGEDIPMEIGTPVHSRFAGKVISRNASRDLGISVEIDHGDGYSSIYGHLNQKVVQTGQEVQVGTLLGKSGATGRVRGPHLHFELRKGKVPTDPKLYTAGGNGNSTSGSSGGGTGSAGSTGGSKVILGTGSEKEWATGLLKKLGAPVQDSSINALTTWMRHEGGHWKNSANYNPLNTTLDVSNNESMNGVGVKRYKSWEEGYTGTIGTLTGNKAGDRGYTAIVDALKAGAPTNDILAAINNSAWMTGKTGKNPYKFQGGPTDGFNTSVNSATPGTGMSSTSPGVPTSLQGGTNNVYVTLQIQQANQQEAEAFAKTIKKYLEKDNKLHEMGRR